MKDSGFAFHWALIDISDTAKDLVGISIIPCCTATVTIAVFAMSPAVGYF